MFSNPHDTSSIQVDMFKVQLCRPFLLSNIRMEHQFKEHKYILIQSHFNNFQVRCNMMFSHSNTCRSLALLSSRPSHAVTGPRWTTQCRQDVSLHVVKCDVGHRSPPTPNHSCFIFGCLKTTSMNTVCLLKTLE